LKINLWKKSISEYASSLATFVISYWQRRLFEGGGFLLFPYVSTTEICILKFIPITCCISAFSDGNVLTEAQYCSADEAGIAN
jgi:hypothetical protein